MNPTALLDTPKPPVSNALAADIARRHFGLGGSVRALTGERDSNFLIDGPGQPACVVKFANAAEPTEETAFQIALLKHLAGQPLHALVPTHRPTTDGLDCITVHDAQGQPCRVRAYTYLAGLPATQAQTSAAHRRALGGCLGRFDAALASFSHPGLQRDFLWNLLQLGQLVGLVHHVDDAELREIARHFIDVFAAQIVPALSAMRQQPIHNDLSKSNYLVDPLDHDRIVGLLDFGDAVVAPLICDPAIAASYQIQDADDPVAALQDTLEGHAEHIDLTEDERSHMLDLTLARVVQRLVMTEWRAARFPDNRAYILRHNPDARRLALLLAPVWRRTSRHTRPGRLFPVARPNASPLP